MTTEKRKRTSNFTQSEKDLLLDCIAAYKYIIENKKTTTAAIREKELVWVRIKNSFNTRSETVRSIQSLKNCWENMKRKCRKHLKTHAFDKKQLEKFGWNPLDDKLKNILNTSSLEECDTLYNFKVVHTKDLEAETTKEESTLQHSIAKPETKEEESRSVLLSRPVTVILKPLHSNTCEEESCIEQLLSTEPVATVDANRKETNGRKASDAENSFWEEKKKLVSLMIEHAFLDEKRKAELHELEKKHRKMRIELCQLEIEEKRLLLL